MNRDTGDTVAIAAGISRTSGDEPPMLRITSISITYFPHERG